MSENDAKETARQKCKNQDREEVDEEADKI
jgi:hypothetical protein